MPSRPRTIHIRPVLNGYLVEVDCQVVVFQSREALLGALSEYYKDPFATEKFYVANAVNAPSPHEVGQVPEVGVITPPRGEPVPPPLTDVVRGGPYPVGAGEVQPREQRR